MTKDLFGYRYKIRLCQFGNDGLGRSHSRAERWKLLRELVRLAHLAQLRWVYLAA